MRHMKTIHIPASERSDVDFVTCDLCKEKIEESRYEVDEVEIRRKTGVSYPESGNGIKINVDMCGKCFDEKLMPWLRSQGAEPLTDEWDW